MVITVVICFLYIAEKNCCWYTQTNSLLSPDNTETLSISLCTCIAILWGFHLIKQKSVWLGYVESLLCSVIERINF